VQTLEHSVDSVLSSSSDFVCGCGYFKGEVMKRFVALVVVLSSVAIINSGCEKAKTTNPSGTKAITLTKPSNESITQGGTQKVNVSISRKGFNDAVKIEFSGLPTGVTVEDKDLTIAKDVDKSSVNLKAADDAKVGEATVTVKVSGGGLDASEPFKLTVKAK